MNSELKLCPFCGSEAAYHKNANNGTKVVCTNANCPCETWAYRTEGEARKAWNKRADNEQANMEG